MTDKARNPQSLCVALLLAGLCSTVSPLEAQAAPGAVITVSGTGTPLADIRNINRAVEQATPGGTVRLDGQFRLGVACIGCIRIRGPVTIEGTTDPTGAVPNANSTIIDGGLSPFLIAQERSSPGQVIRIRNLWFRGSTLLSATVLQSFDRTVVQNCRFTEIRPLLLAVSQFRFAVISGFPDIGGIVGKNGVDSSMTTNALLDQFPGANVLFDNLPISEGRIEFVGNYVDFLTTPGPVPFTFGDDNGFALAGCQYDTVVMQNNYLATRGEALEIEGCLEPSARHVVSGNTVVMDAPLSVEAFYAPPGGHPAAVKVLGNAAATERVINNRVRTFGARAGVCMLLGTVNPASNFLVRGNQCDVDGQIAALLGGYPGFPFFYPVSFLSNARVLDNTFTGVAVFGLAFFDIPFIGLPSFSLVNQATGNVFRDNDLSGLVSTEAALYFDAQTSNNIFVGDPNGAVVDLGTNNLVAP